MISSKLKTWLKRNGFRGEGSIGSRTPMRQCSGYVVRKGIRYRFREKDGVVDIGEHIDTFDRWANSITETLPISEFIERW